MNEKYSETPQQEINFEEADIEEKQKVAADIKQTPEMIRLAYYTLLSAAMSYRNEFFQQEIDTLAAMQQRKTKNVRKLKSSPHHSELERLEKRLINFKKMAEEEIGKFSSNPTYQQNFINVSDFIAKGSVEMLLAKDHHEMLMLLKMYNDGALDVLFEEYRKKKPTQKDETTTTDN